MRQTSKCNKPNMRQSRLWGLSLVGFFGLSYNSSLSENTSTVVRHVTLCNSPPPPPISCGKSERSIMPCKMLQKYCCPLFAMSCHPVFTHFPPARRGVYKREEGGRLFFRWHNNRHCAVAETVFSNVNFCIKIILTVYS